MSEWLQLAAVVVPWAVCGMVGVYANDTCRPRLESAAVWAFGLWAVSIGVLLAVGVIDADLLFG